MPFSKAFPNELSDAVGKLSASIRFSDYPYNRNVSFFKAFVNGQEFEIPQRVMFDRLDDTLLNKESATVYACMLSRHVDGRLREEWAKILSMHWENWVMPYVLRLIGEYVPEISATLLRGIENFNPKELSSFLKANPEPYELVQRQVVSYHNEYYREVPLTEYPPFLALKRISEIGKTPLSRKVFSKLYS